MKSVVENSVTECQVETLKMLTNHMQPCNEW